MTTRRQAVLGLFDALLMTALFTHTTTATISALDSLPNMAPTPPSTPPEAVSLTSESSELEGGDAPGLETTCPCTNTSPI
jgi:hypothetical protein